MLNVFEHSPDQKKGTQGLNLWPSGLQKTHFPLNHIFLGDIL